MSEIEEDNVIDNKKIILKDELFKILPKTGKASIAVDPLREISVWPHH